MPEREPPPFVLAQELAPLLAEMHWGIGGSLLLWKLGLEANPKDLDIMTTAEHFDSVRQRLAQRLGEGVRTPHPSFRSTCFARFESPGSAPVDLFAEVSVRRNDEVESWRFDPQHVEYWRGLPWMLPSAWLELYKLFDRPERVRALQGFLGDLGRSP